MRAALAALLAVAATGCGVVLSKADAVRERIVDVALDQVGENYRYGGETPAEGFDCSGLVQYSYKEAGLKLPRTAASQKRAGRPITFKDARPADLLFYSFGDRKKGDLHVVIYLGGGKGVHAPVRDGEVEVIKIGERHWRDRYVGAVRYVRED